MNSTDRIFEEMVARMLPEIVSGAAPFQLVRSSERAGENVDLCFDLHGEGISRTLLVEVKRNPRPGDVASLREDAERARALGATLLVVAPALEAGLGSALRQAGISHADLRGTVFLQAPGIAVRVEGARQPAPVRAGGSEQNPFADRASLVLRAMMREPERVWGVRELAAAVGISVGLASQTAAEIERRGYATEEGARLALADPAAALVDWAGQTPWPRNRIRSFVAPFADARELASEAWRLVERLSPGHTALTQLAALDEYAPHVVGHGQVHLYCAPEDFEAASAAITASLYAEPVRHAGNLHLVRPSARRSTGFDARELGGVRVVSPVQLFLDLAVYPVRGSEGAGMLTRTVLAAELGLDREAVARVLASLEAR